MMCSWMRLFPLIKLPESSHLRRVAALGGPAAIHLNGPVYKDARSAEGTPFLHVAGRPDPVRLRTSVFSSEQPSPSAHLVTLLSSIYRSGIVVALVDIREEPHGRKNGPASGHARPAHPEDFGVGRDSRLGH